MESRVEEKAVEPAFDGYILHLTQKEFDVISAMVIQTVSSRFFDNNLQIIGDLSFPDFYSFHLNLSKELNNDYPTTAIS